MFALMLSAHGHYKDLLISALISSMLSKTLYQNCYHDDSTVSTILSGLETRSLGLNTLDTT